MHPVSFIFNLRPRAETCLYIGADLQTGALKPLPHSVLSIQASHQKGMETKYFSVLLSN